MNMIEKRRRMRGQGGFTLIELLVVIAILGVLAGVVVFAVGGINDNSKDSACKIDKRTLQTAVQAFRANSGSYPANEAALVPGFLEDVSDKWDYTAPANLQTGQPTYTATASGGC